MNKNIIKRIIQVLFTFILTGVIMFLSAWTIKWQWAWALISANIIILIINLFVLPAEVIEERGRKKENVKTWDRILTVISIAPYFGLYVVAGLDYRFYWSAELEACVHSISLLCYFLGSMLVTWAMVSNRFFSTMVRLQTDRGHQVATGGPYRLVRHPGYVGFIVSTIAVPLILGSLYGLIVSAISVIIFIIRTALEDRTLKAELEGYLEYSKRVKYRLLPYIW
jgi:protein-S-isoprenylcysteine O-methyltransferase Ste14